MSKTDIRKSLTYQHYETIIESKGGKKIKILKDTLNDADDIETLEDMLQLAFNESVTKIEQEKEKKLGAYANGLNGLL